MPDSPTPRLGLYKSASDGSELVNYSQDIGGNLDILDASAGAVPCASSTRPSAPWAGMLIRETDTSRVYVWSGSAWLEIVTADQTPNFTAGLIATGPASGTGMFSTFVNGDSSGRFGIQANGTLTWGSGSATRDTNLYRSAANTLKTDDAFVANVETATSGATAATNWAVTTYAARRTCGVATIYVALTYSGSTLTASSSGNLADTLAVTLPSGWTPASGSQYETTFNKGNLASGCVSVMPDGTCTLRTLDPTATIASGDAIDFSATYVL